MERRWRCLLSIRAAMRKRPVEAYRQLTASDKVLAVIGPLFSSTFAALRPVTNEEKVPIIATASAKPGLSDLKKYPYAFRMTVSSEKKEVTVAQAWIKANNIKTVVILYDRKNIFTRALGRKTVAKEYSRIKRSKSWIRMTSSPLKPVKEILVNR
jgi:ABC-type branched-subunit amino acid transport system substrate-binding protein